jgi:hypothetical protein
VKTLIGDGINAKIRPAPLRKIILEFCGTKFQDDFSRRPAERFGLF